MPPHVLFLARHALIGFAIAALFVGAMVGFDVGGFATLAGKSGAGPLAVAVLTFFLGLTFASVQMGAAIMLLPKDDGDASRGGGSARAPAGLVPALSHAVARRR